MAASLLRPHRAAVLGGRLRDPALAEPARAHVPAPQALVVEALRRPVLLPLAGLGVALLEHHEDVHEPSIRPGSDRTSACGAELPATAGRATLCVDAPGAASDTRGVVAARARVPHVP